MDRQRAEALATGRPGVQVATDYRLALADPGVDAVCICLPHNLHAPVAVEAAQAAKHILCEKPIADDLAAADRMIEAAARARVTLMIAENERFAPIYHKVRQLLQEGVVGRPALLQMARECYLTRSFLEERRWFLNKRAAAGGMMMSGGVHSFEIMRMLIGDVESVQALRARQRFLEMEGDDTSIALIRFCDGTVATLVESFVMKSLATAAGNEVHSLRIDGDLGSLVVPDRKTIHIYSEKPGWLPGGELVQHDILVPEADTFLLEAEHFVQCVRSGDEPITSGRSQREPLRIVLAAYQSMETGLPIRLSA